MKNPVRSLILVAIAAGAALVAQAQPAPKILVIEMARVYDTHYKTEEQNAKLRGDEAKANEELTRLNAEGNKIVDEFKELYAQVNNPALTAEAKKAAEDKANQKFQEVQRKQEEVRAFQMNTRQSLQQRIGTFRNVMLEEISKAATEVAKKKGATLLIDKSGPSLLGIPVTIYSDAAYDITDEVIAEVNKGRPATPVAAPAAPAPTAAPAAAAPAAGSSDIGLKVPGSKK